MSFLEHMGIQQWRLRGRKPRPAPYVVDVANSEARATLPDTELPDTELRNTEPAPVSNHSAGRTLTDMVAAESTQAYPEPPSAQSHSPALTSESVQQPVNVLEPQTSTEPDAQSEQPVSTTATNVKEVEPQNDDVGVPMPVLRPAPVPIDNTPPIDLGIEPSSPSELPPEYAEADVPPHAAGDHQYDEPRPLESDSEVPAQVISVTQGAAPDSTDLANLDWRALQALISHDQACPSCGHNHSILGMGDVLADWMFIAGAPTSDEIQAQQLFVGRAGQLYEAILEACGLQRDEVYTTTVFKCSPPADLSLSPQCDKLIHRQIELVKPKVIVAFGEFAAQAVLRANEPFASLAATHHRYFNSQISVIPSYTPQQLLADPALKAELWSKLKSLMN